MNSAADDERKQGHARRGNFWQWFVFLALVVAVGFLAFTLQRHFQTLDEQMTEVQGQLQETLARLGEVSDRSQDAIERATQAEQNAQQAALGRTRAEQSSIAAAEDAATARQEANVATQQARLAREEADRIRQQREQEIERMRVALSQIAETERTALGLVMSLGSDSIRFDFDQAVIRPQDRELLSRIAGVLLASYGYRIHIYGHTDDIGTEEYNQDLSERRARAVRDYFVEVGIDPEIISNRGYGKSTPRVAGTSQEARSRNRRVEIGIIDTVIDYEGIVARSEP
jgi:outer membrane protein OmpA-like peptidoglycan-associated protein